MTVSFITAINGVISGHHHGDINDDLYGTPYYGHEKIEVPYGVQVSAMERVDYYTPEWKRKPEAQLIREGLLPMPKGYVWDGGELRRMTPVEKVLAGLVEVPSGYKLAGGEFVEMTPEEKIEAGQLTQEDYNSQCEAENIAELQRRLAELQTPEALAQAEVDEGYAAERKAKLAALLAVKKQQGWPITVDWPE